MHATSLLAVRRNCVRYLLVVWAFVLEPEYAPITSRTADEPAALVRVSGPTPAVMP